MSRTRLNIFIEPAHAKRLDQVSAHKGVSKSAVIAAALASFLSPDGDDQREAALAKRLDRLSRQFDRLERDQGVLIETVALYLRQLPDRGAAGTRTPAGGHARPGPRPLRAVHRATGPPYPARAQPGSGGSSRDRAGSRLDEIGSSSQDLTIGRRKTAKR
jgi:hypothetical protein